MRIRRYGAYLGFTDTYLRNFPLDVYVGTYETGFRYGQLEHERRGMTV